MTELWRVSLRVAATKGIDYGSFVNELQQTVEPVMAAQAQRVAVLKQIDQKRREQGRTGGALTGARVLLVGVPGNQAPAPAEMSLHTPVDQHRIFARTLIELLTNSRLRLETTPLEGGNLPESIVSKLTSYDRVVLLDDAPGINLANLKQSGLSVVDARQHIYTPGGNQKTAWQSNPASVAAVYTGVVPIVYKAQRMLLDSLIQSTFWSVVTITPLLMWIARSFSAGSVAMLPNVLPILMVFGGMGWLGVEVDVGSMMTASIALGVAVDDTIHYLNWFREGLDRIGDRKKAILAAYKHCATPTLQAAVISGLGLSVFAISTFTPTQRFGVLMLVILWLGAIAELIYFPALLAGPLGMVFRPRLKAGQPSPEDGHGEAPADSAEPRQPQFNIVHREDAGEEAAEPALSVVGSAESDDSGPGPHSTKPGALRHLRQDTPHRRT